MKASDFDKEFDDGNDVFANLDLSQAKRTTQTTKRVNVDFPEWMIDCKHLTNHLVNIP